MRKHDQGSATAARDRKGRFSARRKRATVLRLLRGEDLESVSRELGITAARAGYRRAWRRTTTPGCARTRAARSCHVAHTGHAVALIKDESFDRMYRKRSFATHARERRPDLGSVRQHRPSHRTSQPSATTRPAQAPKSGARVDRLLGAA